MLLPLLMNLGMFGELGGEVEPPIIGTADVIRNRSRRLSRARRGRRGGDDRYQWLRQPRAEDAPPQDRVEAQIERAKVVQAAIEIAARVAEAVKLADQMAELQARLQLEAARQAYLATYEKAYRDAMRDELLLQLHSEVADFERKLLISRRAALLLLLANV